MKRPQPCAVAGGPFGKHRHAIALPEGIDHFPTGARRVMAPRSFDEQGSYLHRQPADHRPGAHLGLGNKTHRADRIEQVNIQPGNMVGDEHHARRRRIRHFALDAEPDVEDGEHAYRPATDQRCAPGLVGVGK